MSNFLQTKTILISVLSLTWWIYPNDSTASFYFPETSFRTKRETLQDYIYLWILKVMSFATICWNLSTFVATRHLHIMTISLLDAICNIRLQKLTFPFYSIYLLITVIKKAIVSFLCTYLYQLLVKATFYVHKLSLNIVNILCHI